MPLNIADLKFAYFGGGIDAEYNFYAEGVAAGGSAGNPWYVGANTGEDMIRLSVTGEATFRWMVQANGEIQWGNGTDAADTNLYRLAANNLYTDDTFGAGGTIFATVLQTNNTGGFGYVQVQEQSQHVANGASDTGRIYCFDNGAGKTQLVVRFNTGDAIVLATEA